MGKVQDSNKHGSNLTSARFKHVDGSTGNTSGVVINQPARLLRVLLNTNGSTLTLKNGAQEVVAVIASDAPEQSFPYGIWCNNSIRFECGGQLDATIVFDV